MKNLLQTELQRMNVTSTTETIDQLLQLKSMILEKNKVMNLTTITDDGEFLIKHILDSAYVLSLVDIPMNARLLDLGSGAGFPGLVIKILRKDIEMVLLDARKKRCDFLNDCIEKMMLEGVYAVHGRAEEISKAENYHASFDLVVSRAVAKFEKLIPWSLPFLKKNKMAIYMKSMHIDEELEALRQNKNIDIKTIPYVLPKLDIPLQLVITNLL